MSFVYAEKINGTLDILCDTKIGLDRFAGVSFSKEQIEEIIKYGIVKISVICPEIAIAFAGNNIFFASKLFNLLYEMRTFSTQDVVDMAYKIHLEGDINDIEFIVASCEESELSLYCIKGREVLEDCPFAWIGSPTAHREFQIVRNKDNNGRASDRTRMAFLEIVQSCSDDSVGGFCIAAGYNQSLNALGYRECKTFQNSKSQIVKPGDNIKFYMSAMDGGFSFEQIPISEEDLLLRIDQMEYAILYSRRFRMCDKDKKNTQLFSLMLPMRVYEDEMGNWKRG